MFLFNFSHDKLDLKLDKKYNVNSKNIEELAARLNIFLNSTDFELDIETGLNKSHSRSRKNLL